MRGKPIFLGLTVVLFGAVVGPAGAQEVCHDWDGDEYLGGLDCAGANDCEDLSWRRHPGAREVCDGLLQDCDLGLDEGCDRYCDEPALFPVPVYLDVEEYPETGDARVALLDEGFLEASRRILSFGGTRAFVRAYDRGGAPWAEASAVGDPPQQDPQEELTPRIASAGDRALVAWRDWSGREAVRLFARLVDRLGRPMGPVLDLDATNPIPGGREIWWYPDVVWNGEEFAVFWIPLSDCCGSIGNHLLMTRIHADGTLFDPPTVIVTDDVDGDGSRREIDRVHAVWVGDRYVLGLGLAGAQPRERTLAVSRDGVPLGPAETIPVDYTLDDIARGSDRVALVGTKLPACCPDQFWAVLVDFEGHVLDSPGPILLGELDETTGPTEVRVASSWEMFFIGTSVIESGFDGDVPKWLLWRMLPDGTVLDPEPVLLAGSASRLQDLHWAGGDLWWFSTEYGTDRLVRHRVVCSCGDGDGDRFDACLGGTATTRTRPSIRGLAKPAGAGRTRTATGRWTVTMRTARLGVHPRARSRTCAGRAGSWCGARCPGPSVTTWRGVC